MKSLIFSSGLIFILLVSACSSKLSPQNMDLTEEPQVFLPVISEFDGNKSETTAPTYIPVITATAETGQTAEPEMTRTPDPVTSTPAQNPGEISGINPFNPLFQIPIPVGYTQEIDTTYRYGTTQNGTRIPHDGVEFYNASGTPVLAAADGTVFFAGTDDQTKFGQFKNFYGNLVILEHKFTGIEYPVFSLYAHLSAINVDTGDQINLGDKIGEVGASGSAIGSHLHFEVRLNLPNLENRVNPELYLKLINNNQEYTNRYSCWIDP